MNNEPLTFESLIDILNKIKPLPFLGFTVTPAFWEKVKNDPLVKHSTETIASGAMVVVVAKQVEDCLQWDDKAKMEFHIERTSLPC